MKVLNSVLVDQVPVCQAAEVLGVSERHTRRILRAYKKEGARALSHGNRGRLPVNATDETTATAVVELARTRYAGTNHTHLTELLMEREGIELSRPTVRRTLVTAELTPLLKRLKLSAMMDTLPERIALARREQLDYSSFLEIILVDEISRRENRRIDLRLRAAGFEETCRLEDFDWSASITLDGRLLDAVCPPWNSSSSMSTSYWWDRQGWARASWPKP